MARLVSTLSLEKGTPNTTTAHLLLVMQRDQLGLSVEGATVVVGMLLCSPSQCGGLPTPWLTVLRKGLRAWTTALEDHLGGPINRL